MFLACTVDRLGDEKHPALVGARTPRCPSGWRKLVSRNLHPVLLVVFSRHAHISSSTLAGSVSRTRLLIRWPPAPRVRDRGRWRCRCLDHLPHAVLCSAEERVCRDQEPPLQDRRHVHLQDRQARSRQGPSCRHRHLHRQEARGSVPLDPQHGRAGRQAQRIHAGM